MIIANAGRPLVRLVPITTPARRTLGFLPLSVPDQFFDVLDDQDLAAWR